MKTVEEMEVHEQLFLEQEANEETERQQLALEAIQMELFQLEEGLTAL